MLKLARRDEGAEKVRLVVAHTGMKEIELVRHDVGTLRSFGFKGNSVSELFKEWDAIKRRISGEDKAYQIQLLDEERANVLAKLKPPRTHEERENARRYYRRKRMELFSDKPDPNAKDFTYATRPDTGKKPR